MAIGDEIMQGVMDAANTVTKAVETGDYSHLCDDITYNVNQAAQKIKDESLKSVGLSGGAAVKNSYGSNTKSVYVNQTQSFVEKRKVMTPFQTRHVSKLSGLGARFMGGMSSIFFFFMTLIGISMIMDADLSTGIPFMIFSAVITGMSAFLWKKGRDRKKLAEQFGVFKKAAGSDEYISIREFSDKVQIPEKELVKTLKQMIRNGMLTGARFDDQETTLILTEHAFDEYLKLKHAQRLKEQETRVNTVDAGDLQGNEAAQRILQEGNAYLVEVRRINDLIPDTDQMSDKLYKLENIMHTIFQQVRKTPDKAQDLRKFMNYYLPTTQKLLNAYVELDNQPQVGDNIVETKKQISDALDTINTAFEKLLDDLFQEQAWDISSDISVMQTMMAQDGLMQGQAQAQAQGQTMTLE